MTDDNIDDLCKDCGPALTAFLEEMASHNKEQMADQDAKFICPTCGKVHEYKPPSKPETTVPPAP